MIYIDVKSYKSNTFCYNMREHTEPFKRTCAIAVRLENFGSFAFLFAVGCRVGKNANVPK